MEAWPARGAGRVSGGSGHSVLACSPPSTSSAVPVEGGRALELVKGGWLPNAYIVLYCRPGRQRAPSRRQRSMPPRPAPPSAGVPRAAAAAGAAHRTPEERQQAGVSLSTRHGGRPCRPYSRVRTLLAAPMCSATCAKMEAGHCSLAQTHEFHSPYCFGQQPQLGEIAAAVAPMAGSGQEGRQQQQRRARKAGQTLKKDETPVSWAEVYTSGMTGRPASGHSRAQMVTVSQVCLCEHDPC